MKIFGIALIITSAVFFSYERNKRKDSSLKTLEELFRFIEHIKIKIGCYLAPVSALSSDFSSDILSEMGFLSDFSTLGAPAAYKSLEEKMCFPEEARRALQRFFSSLGKGYADDEIMLIGKTLSDLSEIIGAEREKSKKEKKLTLTLSTAGALALIILLV